MNDKQWKVLVVDDQKGWCEAIADVLEEAGCSVQFAETAIEAIAKLDNQTFDLAIIDVRLEEQVEYNVEGIDLLQRISESKRELPSVILTGHATPALRQKAEWYGAFAFLEKSYDTKGFDRELFLKTVYEALHQSAEE